MFYGSDAIQDLAKAVKGNAYDLKTSQKNVKLPNTLEQSSKAFSKSKIMPELFGDEWVDHFTLTRQWESKCYNEQKQGDPDWYWMLDRYFEII